MTQAKREKLVAALRDIWREHQGEIDKQIALVEAAVTAMTAGKLDENTREDARRAAHKLVGSLGSFGFHSASEHARVLERHLSEQPPSVEAASRMMPTVTRLREALVGEPSLPAVSEPPRTGPERRKTVLVVTSDIDLADALEAEATAGALEVRVTRTVREGREVVAEDVPDVALLDMSGEKGPQEIFGLLAQLSGHTPPVPTLIVTARDVFTDRVEVARLGGHGYLTKPVTAVEMVEAALRLIERDRFDGMTVLVVDDNPMALDAVRVLLEAEGMNVICLAEPLRFWDELAQASPDLLVLDLDMPDVNGLEICGVVRGDQRWAQLPVLFLTAHNDPDVVQKVFEAGADDYVTKPVVGPELKARIGNRLERLRLYRSLAETDALTGVANRRRLVESMDQLTRLAERYDQPLSVALIDLDRFKQINDTHGHTCGDDVLRGIGALLKKTFRGEDVVARWGGEEFFVGMYGMARSDGVRRLAETLEVFARLTFSSTDGSPFTATFSAGIAQYPEDGSDLQALYRSADEALYRAKAAGRNLVLAADPSSREDDVRDA